MSTAEIVPSAGTQAEGAVTPPSPSGDSGQLSDDQILDAAQTAEAQDGSPTQGSDAGEDAGLEAGAEAKTGDADELKEQAGTEAKPGEQEKPTLDVAEPAKLKEVFRQFPELRQDYYSVRAYREVFPTVAEAREVKGLFPAGLEDAKVALESHEELGRFDDLFYSNDPKDHVQFIRTLHEEDPQAFRNLAQAFPEALYSLDPEAYRADTRERLASIFQALGSRNPEDENLQNAIAVLSQRLLGHARPDAASDPNRQRIEQERSQLQRERQQWNAEQYEGFRVRVDDAVDTAAEKDIRGLLDAVLKGTPVTDSAKNQMAQEVGQQILATLQADRSFRTNLRRQIRAGKFDAPHQSQLVSFQLARVKPLIKPAVQRVVNRWTTEVLALNKQRLQTQRTQANRRDITGGGAAAGRPHRASIPKPGQIDYRATTDDDILDAVAAGDGSRIKTRK